jgi:hypothetical protein
MPDFYTCVKHNGKTYCWDDERGGIVEITMNDVPLGECPPQVIAAIIRSSYKGEPHGSK